MKRINKITTALFLPLIMLFSSCFDPIFYEVRRDVEPESATVSGNIGQITRFTMNGEEYLFLSADGGLRYKKVANETHGSWGTMSLPFSLLSYNYDNSSMDNYQLCGVYADSTTLYLVAIPYVTSGSETTTNPSTLKIWASDTPDDVASWDLIDLSSISFDYSQDESTELYSSLFYFFQTNAPKAAHRHFYFRTYTKAENEESYKYFELIGKAKPTDITNKVLKTKTETDESGNKTTQYVNIVGGGSRANSAAILGGEELFFSSKVVVTDETYNDDADYVYYGNGSDLYYYSTADGYKRSCSAGKTISALAVTNDSILIGLGNLMSKSDSSGGIKRVLLANGIPADSTSDFDSNADFQITSAYKVMALLNATPEKTEADSALYAAITCGYSSSGLDANKGLWSYYPARGNWNRE